MPAERITEATTGELVARIQSGLRKLSQQIRTLNVAVGDRVQLLAGDLAVLDLIDRTGPLSPGEITDATGVHPATLTGILDRLEHGEWICRVPDPDDRRRMRVEPIHERAGELIRLYAPMNKAIARLCAAYKREELAAIVDFMERAAEAGAAVTAEISGPTD